MNKFREAMSQAATKYSGKSDITLDILFQCGQPDHWLMEEKAFKAGWQECWEYMRELANTPEKPKDPSHE